MINAISVKDRLLKISKASGKSMEELLVCYGLERTIYRISVSRYAERFILKGGIFLYGLFEGNFARSTMDVDLLAEHISNEASEMSAVFREIFSIEVDDAVRFDLGGLHVTNITEFKEYHGVNVSIIGYLDKTRVPISLDIGFGDSVYPSKIPMTFPTLLDMAAPNIFAYSITSVISEKFEAIVSLGEANSRFKDFYDIYVLSNEFDLSGRELQGAIGETFSHRGTSLDDIVAFDHSFANNDTRLRMWNSFLKKKKALLNVSFNEAVNRCLLLLEPVVSSIKEGKAFIPNWSHDCLAWVNN